MTSTQHCAAVGVFEDHDQADRAVDELRNQGFRNDQIGVVGPDPKAGSTSTDSRTGSGAVTGAIAGAGVGGLVGLGIVAGVIPVLGPVIAGGTLAVILANAAGGAVIAGIAGALIGLGIPKEDAEHYEGELKQGRTIVTVKDLGERYNEAQAILQRHGGYNKEFPRGATAPATAACSTARTVDSAKY